MNIFKKVFGSPTKFLLKHKIISAILLVILLAGGYWWYYASTSTSGETRYVLSAVTNGKIISSVTGTGQTSALNELDIKPKTSGDLTYLGVVSGQTISKGQLIAKIDPTDAQQAVANAQQALDQARTALEKMKGVQTSLGKLRGVTEKAQDSLNFDYENGFNTVTNAFLNLPGIMTGLQSIIFGTAISQNTQNLDYYGDSANIYNTVAFQYRKSANDSYQLARTSYDASFSDFKITNRTSSKDQIESLINKTYDTIGKISQSTKDAINLIQLYQDEFTTHGITPISISTTHLTSLNSYINSTNTYLSSLLSIRNTIESDKESLIQTSYDITDQENLVADKTTALEDANKNLSYCNIYAPFSGIISAVNVKNSDSISSGTVLAKIITKDVVADVSLNEIDASKVKIGQKVATTFDAIDGLTLNGTVTSIDTIGTVSQGVVSYNVQINFDNQDSRVKPGMSVSTNIIAETKQDVLTVPNSAVKIKNGRNYVLVFDQKQDLTSSAIRQGFVSAIAPTQKIIKIGIADTMNTEIISGLSEGDQVVVRTISGTKTTTTGTTSSANRTTRQATQTFTGGAAGGPPGGF